MGTGPFALEHRRMGKFYHWVEMDEEYGFPLVWMEGRGDGPTLFATAGLHGTEYTGIEALMRFPLILDLERLRGRMLLVPVVNLPAFQQRTATVCPLDGKNLNRIFPGSVQGSYSERLAHRLATEIEMHADFVVDVHGNELGEAVLPLSAVHLTGHQVDECALNMATAYGLPYLVHSSVEQPWGSGGTLFAWAAELGKPAILVQSGGQGHVGEEDVARHLWGLVNLTRELGMQPEEVEQRPVADVFDSIEWMTSDRDGIYRCWVDVGERVGKGQVLGIFYDYFGREIKIELAPNPGTVLYAATAPSARAGAVLTGIGKKRQ